MPTSRATRVTSSANERSWSTIVLMVSASAATSPLASTVIFWDRSPLGDGGGHLGDVADLAGEVAGHQVDVVGEVLPGARHALDVGLAAEVAFGADLAGHAGHLGGERRSWSTIVLMVFFSSRTSPLASTVIFLREVAVGHGGGDLGDVADLAGQVAGHEVDVVGQVLPGAGDALDLGLAAELALGADLAGHAGDLVGEGRQLVDHGVDGLGQGGDLALGVDGDLLGQVAVGDGGGDLGDVAHLVGEVAGHEVDVVGEVLPGARRRPRTSAWPPSLPSVPTSRATRVTSSAKDESWSTMVLMVFFSSRISPLTSTVIFCDRSPLATAVVTWAMLRTWLVRLEAMKFTESVRSFQVPETPFTLAWPPSLPSVPTSRATRVTSAANDESWSTIAFTVVPMRRNSPLTGWPSILSAIFCERSPSATASMTRATSVVGRTRSSISVLTSPRPGPRGPGRLVFLRAVIRPSRGVARTPPRLLASRGVGSGHLVEGGGDLSQPDPPRRAGGRRRGPPGRPAGGRKKARGGGGAG